MINKFYWWIISKWYNLMYSDKIFDMAISDKVFERGDIVVPQHVVVITHPKKVGISYRMKVIPTKYQTTKRELFEFFVLCLFVFMLVIFIYSFIK